MGQITIGEVMDSILPRSSQRNEIPKWPPDAFAIVATILTRTDGYRAVINSEWPPQKNWTRRIRNIGKRWRNRAAADKPAPMQLQEWWRVLISRRDRSLRTFDRDRVLSHAIIQICAAADEASRNIGLSAGDEFIGKSHADARWPASCCIEVDSTRAIVFPKVHTPQTGIAMRSLTHHLALCTSGDVRLDWESTPADPFALERSSRKKKLNLLLLPWPRTIKDKVFSPSPGKLKNLPKNYGFFNCEPDTQVNIRKIKTLCAKAERMNAPVDLIVFPEGALRRDQALKICRRTRKIVVAGITRKTYAGGRKTIYNEATFLIPLFYDNTIIEWRQSKHHRWKLDEGQIVRYGIGERLTPKKIWWENIHIGKRELGFFNLAKGFVTCVLVCEDLARQEPIASAVRAVGPDLVVSLLMDGPQIKARWPAQYASVLADDPGCSVLTLSSIGMVKRSRFPDLPISRTVGLWKSPGKNCEEINLDHGAAGILLELKRRGKNEWTADGRSDLGKSSILERTRVRSIIL